MNIKKKIVIGVGVLVLIGCSHEMKPGYVAQQWSKNSRQLGINPMFPQEGSYRVGDIYLVPVGTDKSINNLPSEYYAFPLVFVTHQTVSADELSGANQFQRTIDWTDSNGRVNKPGPYMQYVVDGQVVNHICSFPGFTFAAASDANGGLGVVSNGFAQAIGFAKKSRYTVSFTVPYPECMSISFIDGAKKFATFKSQLQLDKGIRDWLVDESDQMKQRLAGLQSDYKDKYALSTALIFVTDIYYTRSLNVTITAEDGVSLSSSTTVASLASLSNKRQSLYTQLVSLRAKEGDKPESSQAVSLTKQIDDIDYEMNQKSLSILPTVPGATGTVTSVSANSLVMQQTYAYPIAIGYNGIVRDFDLFVEKQASNMATDRMVVRSVKHKR